jgi:hypothetical protein
MGVYVFSTGVAVARVPDPVSGILQSRKLPTLQEASVKFEGTIKEMFGANVYSEDAAGGSRKITGSFKVGQIRAGALSDLFFSATAATGHPVVVDGDSIPALTPVADVTDVSHTNITDMGLVSGVDGSVFKRVATVANDGEYSVDESAGTYTTNSGDAAAATVRPSYRYTVAGTGRTYEMGNPLLGTIADFEVTLWKPRFTKNLGIILYHAVATSLDLPAKREEYTEATINWSAFVDPSKQSPGQIFTSESD